MLKKVRFKGGAFTEETELELFKNEDRISLLYGKNGSGKSTISKAVLKAKGDDVEDIVQAAVLDHDDSLFAETQCIHVFNEDYVNNCVKICDDGLNAIVLLGELGNLEDKILELELRLEAESNRNAELKALADEYKDRKNKKSPAYCKLQINLGLSGDGHWAEREKIVNNSKRNASVTDNLMDSIMLERTTGLEDMEYLNFLSDEERKRTAREVICFIYLLNKRHVMAHLDGKKDIETNIQKWCADIKCFYSDDGISA